MIDSSTWLRESCEKTKTTPTCLSDSGFGVTLRETNIAPENGWLEYDFPIGFRPIFRGELLVLGRIQVDAIFVVREVIFLSYKHHEMMDEIGRDWG